MSQDTTTIQISIENYKRLNGMKNPGDSFDDVIGRVLDEHEVFRERLERSDQDAVTTAEPEASVPQNQAADTSAAIAETTGETGSGSEPGNERTHSRQMALSSANEPDNDIEQLILDLDLSTSASRNKWLPAIREAYRYLREYEQASKQDFIDDVFPDAPAGYENDQTWWRKVIRPGLTALPGVEKPKAGGKWKYTDQET